MKDLFLLVADKNARFTLEGALNRPKSLGIRPITFDVRVHSGRDGGARTSGPEIIGLEHRRFHHAMLVFDFEGSGTDSPNAVELEQDLDRRLALQWQERAKAIVIDPEVDAWIWAADSVIEPEIGWPAGSGLRPWLREQGYAFDAREKPIRPKEALEAALSRIKLPRSSAIYRRIADRASMRRCTDPAFHRFRLALASWFPAQPESEPGV